ncbi:MAG TPA: tripartite tricarboxylate transporter substrate binding protein [Burkholderiales bacterium]|nr:tripartite tricarboxylate transporter substrate binding protein [Burkholderiales bacterium]
MKSLVIGSIVLGALASAAHAQTSRDSAQGYPAKPIRLVVGFTPGGGVDINARLLAPKLTEYLGQNVIVDNRPGAGTNIANEFVAKAPPDGYTLLVNTAALVINLSLYKKVAFEAKDFAPVSLFSESPNILTVHPSLPVKNVKDLVALAKAKPGSMNFSSAGSGTTQHLTGELFKLRTGTNIVHVPYKGSAPSLTALLGGEVEMTFANIPAISAHVKAKRLRALANAGVKRSAQMADVPTLKESGVNGVEVVVWYGVFAPAATPRDVVNTLAAAIQKSARSPDTRQRLLDQGAEPVGNSPDEFAKLVRAELVRWAEVVKVSGARAD